MLLRRLRTSLAAVRHFSAEAATASVAEVEKPSNLTSSSAKTSGGRDTLGRRLLSLVYDKRSAVIAIQKWREEGHTVRKYELNRIVRELRKAKRYKHALEAISAEGPLVGPDWRPKRSTSLCISLGVKLGNDTDASDMVANCWAAVAAGALSPAVCGHG
ncbi:hypothetical protein RJ639_043123 [Escallonia herrerae]|uniref:Uncharacterized protein n=1 Tax=Escallonia herrerae TaxID=1293975 RepID=A0AA88WBP5_9ASTE|nr:hypothetical protein RJ639_043123 [Escallonia herrerae]